MNPGSRYKMTQITHADGASQHVLIVGAKQYARPGAHGNEIVSEIAGALWEWTPAVCDSHVKDTEEQLEALKIWSQVSYIRFKDIADRYGAKETGIRKLNPENYLHWLTRLVKPERMPIITTIQTAQLI
ncbi:hypothetical protein K493DRAFT_301876 [Basidiobolus meristosporus CBS 931.73]|uniref:Uncharacterized protein n=1 Tax=Basidiobolus meristosporus CBS 931.73 TaxID=1314790 RepID=A0A1Y1YAJ9_9FUNG|nr:hypothetical protein K493DRAFT_301876 [Basidiobolus meristosporus CBS 931.73]|eukprot:ORX94786.1 hypothetical protein K493DRAFT_301876 [Basidiobolus meristosporus CBS 931.73]